MRIDGAAFALAALTVSLTSHAGEFSIKDYTLGMSLEGYRYNYMCKKRGGEHVCIDGAPSDTIAGYQMKSAFLIFNEDGRARHIAITIPSSGYDDIKKAITSKYGKPKCTSKKMQNRFGAQYQNEQCVILKGAEAIGFNRYSNDVESGGVVLTTKKELEEVINAERSKLGDI